MTLGGPNIYPWSGAWLRISRELTVDGTVPESSAAEETSEDSEGS